MNDKFLNNINDTLSRIERILNTKPVTRQNTNTMLSFMPGSRVKKDDSNEIKVNNNVSKNLKLSNTYYKSMGKDISTIKEYSYIITQNLDLITNAISKNKYLFNAPKQNDKTSAVTTSTQNTNVSIAAPPETKNNNNLLTNLIKGLKLKTVKKLQPGGKEFQKLTLTLGNAFKNFGDSKKDAKIKSGIENFLLFSTSFTDAMKRLKKSIVSTILVSLAYPLMNKVIVSFSETYEKLGDKNKQLTKGTTVLTTMGVSFMTFSKKIAIGSLILAPAILLFPLVYAVLKGFSFLYSSIGEPKSEKKIKKGAKAISAIGVSLGVFSLGIVGFSLAMNIVSGGSITNGDGIIGLATGLGAIGLGMITIWGMSLIYREIGGKPFKKILKGSIAVSAISVSLAVIGWGLDKLYDSNYFSQTVDKQAWLRLGFLSATLGGLALVYGIGGKFLKPIIKGSIAFTTIGVSLAIVSWSLDNLYKSDYFSQTVDKQAWLRLGFLSATLSGLALVYGIGGLLLKPIIKGSIAFTTIGVSLVIISWGLDKLYESEYFSQTVDKQAWLRLGFLSATLGGLALVYGIGGLFLSPIIKGVIAFATIGVSLVVIGWGLDKLYESEYFSQTIDKQAWLRLGFLSATLGGLALVYAGVGLLGQTGMPFIGVGVMAAIGASLWTVGWGIDKLYESDYFSSKVDKQAWLRLGFLSATLGGLATAYTAVGVLGATGLPFIGAGLIGAIGLSLKSISNGLIALEKSKILDKSPKEITNIGESLKLIITSIGDAFIMSPIKAVKIWAGIKSMNGTQTALTSVSEGLKAWSKTGIDKKELKLTYDPKHPEIEPVTLLDTIYSTLLAVQQPFAELGKSSGFLGLHNNVAAGMKTVFGTQKALTSVAEGLKAWQNNGIDKSQLVLKYDPKHPEINPVTLLDTIYATLFAIQQPFAAIGESSGFLGLHNNVATGMKTVSGTQKALTSVSEGLKAWQNNGIDKSQLVSKYDPKHPEIEPKTLLDTIYATLSAIQKPFADIGKNKSGKLFSSQNNVEAGIEAVFGTQKALTSVAKGLKAWKTTESIGNDQFTLNYDPDNPEIEPITLLDTIYATLSAIQKPFADIGNDSGLFSSRNNVKAGIEAVFGTQKALTSVSNGIKSFSTIKASDIQQTVTRSKDGVWSIPKEATIMDNIIISTSLISDAFGQIGAIESASSTKIFGISLSSGNITKGAKLAESMGITLSNIANSMLVFSKKGKDYTQAATNSVNFLKTYMTGISAITVPEGSDDIINILSSANSYLKENAAAMQAMDKLDKTINSGNGLTSVNKLFNDIGKLPHDKLKEMFDSMKSLIKEMNDMNEDIIQKQIESYKAQTELIKEEIKKITPEQKTETDKNIKNSKNAQVITTNNQDPSIVTLTELLTQVNDNIQEIYDTLETGNGKIKISNIEDLSL